MHTTVNSLLEEQHTVDLVNATRESIDKITQEITKMRASYNQLSNEIWDTVDPLKMGPGGSRMSHK